MMRKAGLNRLVSGLGARVESRVAYACLVEVFWVLRPCKFVAGYQRYSGVWRHKITRRHNPENLDPKHYRRESKKSHACLCVCVRFHSFLATHNYKTRTTVQNFTMAHLNASDKRYE
jgi:hypothetical protein